MSHFTQTRIKWIKYCFDLQLKISKRPHEMLTKSKVTQIKNTAFMRKEHYQEKNEHLMKMTKKVCTQIDNFF